MSCTTMLRLFLLAFFVVVNDATSSKPRFRPDYTYVAEINGWLKLHRVSTDWFDARERCHLEGAELAFPSDPQMLQAMRSMMTNFHCGIHIGIHALYSKGDYTSIDGTPLWKMPVELLSSYTCTYMYTHTGMERLENKECTIYHPLGSIDTVHCNESYGFMCYRKEETTYNMCDCKTIDHGYKRYTEKGPCYKFHLQPQTWPDAYKICLAEGGHLAIINSVEEAKLISSIFEEHPNFTIQASYKNSLLLGFKKLKGTWSTIHGQSLEEAGYATWSPGKPDSLPHPNPNGTKDYCGSMFRTGLLDDIWCDFPFAFICERDIPEENNITQVAINNETSIVI